MGLTEVLVQDPYPLGLPEMLTGAHGGSFLAGCWAYTGSIGLAAEGSRTIIGMGVGIYVEVTWRSCLMCWVRTHARDIHRSSRGA